MHSFAPHGAAAFILTLISTAVIAVGVDKAPWNSDSSSLAIRGDDVVAYAADGAVSRGYTADVDPDAWRIVDGKLYLNDSKRVQGMGEKDIPGNIEKGRANWSGVLSR